MPIATSVVLPATSEVGRLASFKAAWKRMPTWKKWASGICIASAGLGLTAGIVAATVFTGGGAAIATGVAVACNLAAGSSSALVNGHSMLQAIKAKQYKRAAVAGIGCIAGALGTLGSIFHFASAVNAVAQTDIAISAGSGAIVSSVGAVCLSLAARKKMAEPKLHRSYRTKVSTSYRKITGLLPEAEVSRGRPCRKVVVDNTVNKNTKPIKPSIQYDGPNVDFNDSVNHIGFSIKLGVAIHFNYDRQ